MALNFPNSPTLNQIYTAGNRSWQWNGRFWQSISVTVGYTGSQGFVGSAGIDGIVGVDGYTGSQGATGTSVRIVGSLADQSLLPDPYSGDIGDGYLLADTGHLWLWNGTAWNDIGQLSGEVGPTGFAGSAGFTGSVGFVGSVGESSFTWGPTAPVNPAVGDRWYDTSELILLVYLDDGDSLQWVEVNAAGFQGQSGFTGSAGLSGVLVQTVTHVGQATAADTQGGETLGLSGAGFQSGITVYVGSTACAATLVDSSNLTFVSPAKGAGVYDIVVYNSNGSSGTRPRGIEYSGAPVWVTSATLPAQTVDAAVSIILSATSNSAVTYFLQQGSSMPAGLSLSSAGVITGTVTGIEEETEYTFTVVAIDAESQTTPRSFSLVVKNIITAGYLVMAGGGSGGHAHAGGGGAGGYRESSTVINPGTNYTVTIGAGAAGATNRGRGNSGSNSVFGSISATGGGGGGSQVGASEGIAGGSGGGGGNATSGSKAGGQGNTGGYSPVEGYPGGSAAAGSSWVSAGGGGAAEAGFPSSGSTPGNGGSGRSSSITGTSIFRAGGGGGCGEGDGTGGVGGAGGGTNGSGGTSGSISAVANSGSGSGGTRDAPGTNLTPSGAGGSGVVIIKYPNSLTIINADGGLSFATSTAVAGYKITTFTAGTGNIAFYRNSDVIEVEYLVIAGGGGGGDNAAGGGGAGGFRTDTLSLPFATSIVVTVGAGGNGGSGGSSGNQGSNSVFNGITSTGGGAGVHGNAGGAGGSGGGAGYGTWPGGASVSPSQGNIGGSTTGTGAPYYTGAGGGGAGQPGASIVATYSGGAGGNGANSSITGSVVTYAGGGAGAPYVSGGAVSGGTGGGGSVASGSAAPDSGDPNTGGGGAAAPDQAPAAGGAGGSGVVIIAYPDSHAAPTAISGGLVYDQPTRAGYRVYRFTQGTGNITF